MRVKLNFTLTFKKGIHVSVCKFKPFTTNANRVVKKIESSKRDGKSNRGGFLIFILLMIVKLRYLHSEKLVHLSEFTVKCTGSWLILTTLCKPFYQSN